MPKKSFYINESELDGYQEQVIRRRTDKSFLVKGCAGSGKSILALWKVKQIQEENMGSFYFILFTKTLKQYMKDGITDIGLRSDRVLHYDKWRWRWTMENGTWIKHENAPSADYIIVDEAQDFAAEDIDIFKSKANKALIMYGDSAQQIYKFRTPEPISMEQIAAQTSFPSEQLVFNHRLPKKIARLAEQITNSDDELELRCRNEGTELPKVLLYNNLILQLDAIIEIIKNRQFEDVGIFFRNNTDVKYAEEYIAQKGIDVEAKYDIKGGASKMTLNFSTDKPKLTTYHSSKGLQFEAVFIPNCTVSDEDYRSPLYVAITRSYQSLFIMHSGDLSPFFNDVSDNLYETSLISKSSRRL
ncbi:MAG: UvrD-helicase domain-containing protein [Bacteroidetes bacterium]|nr:UvrD-helicase domain-containing protein [Bacteroidota bacterium]